LIIQPEMSRHHKSAIVGGKLNLVDADWLAYMETRTNEGRIPGD
jgi:hypothetical protein